MCENCPMARKACRLKVGLQVVAHRELTPSVCVTGVCNFIINVLDLFASSVAIY